MDNIAKVLNDDAFKVQCSKALAYLEGVVVRARHDPVAAELKAGDDVIVVTLENPRGANRKNSPVHLDVVLAHVAGLKRKKILIDVKDVSLFEDVAYQNTHRGS